MKRINQVNNEAFAETAYQLKRIADYLEKIVK